MKAAITNRMEDLILFAMWRDDKQWYYNQDALQASKAA